MADLDNHAEIVAALKSEVAGMKAQVAQLESRLTEESKLRIDTHEKVTAMFNALMLPQWGHGDKSLLERMADVTVNFESGVKTGDNMLQFFKYVGVLAVVGGVLAALSKFFLKE